MQTEEFFKALGDATRLHIVTLLRQQPTLCVCEITQRLKQPQPTISRHLNHLKRVGILDSERRGTWMWYRLADQLPSWCDQIIQQIPDQAHSAELQLDSA